MTYISGVWKLQLLHPVLLRAAVAPDSKHIYRLCFFYSQSSGIHLTLSIDRYCGRRGMRAPWAASAGPARLQPVWGRWSWVFKVCSEPQALCGEGSTLCQQRQRAITTHTVSNALFCQRRHPSGTWKHSPQHHSDLHIASVSRSWIVKRRRSHHSLHWQSDKPLVMIQIWIQSLGSRNQCVDLGLIHMWFVSWMWIRIIFKQGCSTTRGQIVIKLAILVGLIPGNTCYTVWRHQDKFQVWTYFINVFFFSIFITFEYEWVWAH